MGRPTGPTEMSPAAEHLIELLKANIRRRLRVLEISSTIVGERTGRGWAWLRDVLESDRYNRKISVNMVADIGEAIGAAPSNLLSEHYSGWGRVPRWYVERPPLRKTYPPEEVPS